MVIVGGGVTVPLTATSCCVALVLVCVMIPDGVPAVARFIRT
jgi:hypothetical protein